METAIPEARGFAAALETYLSRGGGTRSDGKRRKAGFRYTEGPIKGLTIEQATQKARELWAKAPESVRSKYANRDSRLLTRSERLIQGISPAPSGAPAGTAGQAPSTVAPAAPPVDTAVPSPADPASIVPGLTRPAPPAADSPQPEKPVDWQGIGVAERPPAPDAPSFLAAPSRSQAIAAGAVEGGKRINKLTGKPFGWIPDAGVGEAPAPPDDKSRYAGPRTSYVPGYGMVPKAEAVPEGPVSYEDYDKIRGSLENIDPASPEASAARGRMRTFEEQARAREVAEMKAKREASLRPTPVRLGVVRPTAADRYAASGYGMVNPFPRRR